MKKKENTTTPDERLAKAHKRAQAIQESQRRSTPANPPQVDQKEKRNPRSPGRKDPKKNPKTASSSSPNIYIDDKNNSKIEDSKYVREVIEEIKLVTTNTDNPESADLMEDFDGLTDDDLQQERPLTDREKLFLTLYFTTGKMDMAVKQAGYKSKHQQSRNLIGNRILQKYCAAMEDRRKILRELGISEVALAMLLWDKARSARSETVQLNALKTLASIHGLLKDEDEAPPATSISFHFDGSPEELEQVGRGDRSADGSTAPGKPVSIVK
jgi:hypothetical protein